MQSTVCDARAPRTVSHARMVRFLLCSALCILHFPHPPAAAAQPARVIIVSIDGLRADVVTPGHTPNLAAFRDAGTCAKQAVNDLPNATLPNHVSMLTGIVGNRHGLIWDFRIPGVVALPTVFDYAAQAGRRCAFLASKTKLEFVAPQQSLETIEFADPVPLAAMAIELLHADGPDLIFLHLREPDSTGHRIGWLSEQYMLAVAEMDALVGDLAAAAEADDSRRTYFIITSDHGGVGMNHIQNIPEVRQIPWIVAGPGIVAGGRIEEVVSTVDTTPTALLLLDVDVPGGLSGRARREVFDPAALTGDNHVVPPVGIPCLLLIVPGFLLVARRVRMTNCE